MFCWVVIERESMGKRLQYSKYYVVDLLFELLTSDYATGFGGQKATIFGPLSQCPQDVNVL
jgi:hypothetical protein